VLLSQLIAARLARAPCRSSVRVQVAAPLRGDGLHGRWMHDVLLDRGDIAGCRPVVLPDTRATNWNAETDTRRVTSGRRIRLRESRPGQIQPTSDMPASRRAARDKRLLRCAGPGSASQGLGPTDPHSSRW
jgi:hypothetical protein